MRYRVAFAKRFESDGRESATDPTAAVDVLLADGVVADKALVERLEPFAQHSQETLDEDDAFLASAAPEVWEYDVVDERAGEFEDALRNAETVIEFDVLDKDTTESSEVSDVALSDSNPFAVQENGSSVRAGGEGANDLTILTEDDRRLGLTNRGPSPDRNGKPANRTDPSSTLRRPKSRKRA